MQEETAEVGLNGYIVNIVRFFKSSNTRWNEFPLLLDALRSIEGNFGSGVGCYFRFLRWVILLNLNLAFVWFGFVIIPWLLDPPSGDNPFSGLTFGGVLTGDGLEDTCESSVISFEN